MKKNKKLFVLACLLWINLPIVSSQGLYRQSHSQQAGSEKVSSGREEISGFLFESKSALTKPELPGDVGAPAGDGYLILLALIGGYIVYSKKSLLRRPLNAVSSLPAAKQSGTGCRLKSPAFRTAWIASGFAFAMTILSTRHCEPLAAKQSRTGSHLNFKNL